MIEKCKALSESLKNLVLGVVAPLAALAALVMLFLKGNKPAPQAETEQDKKTDAAIKAREEVRNESEKASADWERIRGDYIDPNSGSGAV